MQIHRDIGALPEFRNAVITIGTFDGVHLGHRQIIDSLKQEAEKAGGESVIITFHPHPRKVVSSVITGVRLINTLPERIELLEKTGIDHLVIVPFTDFFANQPAEEYIRDFLVEKFRPHTIIIGYDHRFGKERSGDYKLMEEMAPVYNYQLKEISEHKPIDVQTLHQAARDTNGNLVVVEDHWLEGGLGDAVLDAFAGNSSTSPYKGQQVRIIKLGVRNMPTSGTLEELLHAAKIDADAIVEAVKSEVRQLVGVSKN